MQDNDLISRATAIDYLMTNMVWHDADGYEVDDADEKRAIITDLVNGIPAVDAAPVVHGRWIEDRTHIMCSVCGARYKDEIVFMPDACMSGQIYDGLERCPHCGAILNVAASTCGPDYCEIGGEDDADGETPLPG